MDTGDLLTLSGLDLPALKDPPQKALEEQTKTQNKQQAKQKEMLGEEDG